MIPIMPFWLQLLHTHPADEKANEKLMRIIFSDFYLVYNERKSFIGIKGMLMVLSYLFINVSPGGTGVPVSNYSDDEYVYGCTILMTNMFKVW